MECTVFFHLHGVRVVIHMFSVYTSLRESAEYRYAPTQDKKQYMFAYPIKLTIFVTRNQCLPLCYVC